MSEQTPETDAGRGGSGRGLVVIALVVGLAVGLGLAALLARGGDDEAAQSEPQSGGVVDAVDPDLTAELPPADPVIPIEDATTAEAAIRGFLAAEAAGEWETSYDFLPDAVQQTAFTSPAAWVNQHADLPTITGYRVDEVVADDVAGTATADTLVAYDAVLDPVIGLVPARSKVTWTLQQAEDGTWRIGEQQGTPLYPDSSAAAEVAREWVDAKVACEDATGFEADAVGAPSLGEALCTEDQPEVVEIGTIGPLVDSSETAPLISEFGAEVFAWARTARVEATTPFLVVMGPVGLEWRVVGVIRAI